MPVKTIAAGLALLLCGFTCRDAPADPSSPLRVRTMGFEGAEFIVADADMGRVRLRMLSRGAEVRSLRDAEAVLRRRGERALLVTNGGLFNAGAPLGLQVEDGRVVRPLRAGSTPAAGENPGNFFYLPNAVLFQDRTGRVAIRESSRMAGREGEVRDGLQSGPALLLGGRVHPIAAPPNRGRAHDRRSAACVSASGRLSIVFARTPTTFPQLARFLVKLGCRDATFLDANVTGLYIPGHGVSIREEDFAGVLVLAEPVATR